MEFKHWIINEEIYQNKTAVVYHRTKEPSNIKSILQSGFRPGATCTYGCGFYATYELADQFIAGMDVSYGSYIMAYKAINLDQYLVLNVEQAIKIHGVDWKLSTQIPKLSKSLENKINNSKITPERLDEIQEKVPYTSQILKILAKEANFGDKTYGIKGVIYEASNHGRCLLKYEPINEGSDLILLRYGYAPVSNGMENIQWISKTSLASIRTHSVYQKQLGKKDFQTGLKPPFHNLLKKSENLEKDTAIYTENELKHEINALADGMIDYLFTSIKDKQGLANLVIKYKKELNGYLAFLVLRWSPNVLGVAKRSIDLISKIEGLSEREIGRLLAKAEDQEGIVILIQKYASEKQKAYLREQGIDI